MKLSVLSFLFLAACAGQTTPVYEPVAVDMPVPLACHASMIAAPQNYMDALPGNATLTQFTKACLQQTLADQSVISEMQAALKACGN